MAFNILKCDDKSKISDKSPHGLNVQMLPLWKYHTDIEAHFWDTDNIFY